MAITFHGFILVTALILHRSSGTRNDAPGKGGILHCLHVQPTWVSGHVLYKWQKKFTSESKWETLRSLQNTKLLTSLQPRTVLLWLAYLGHILLRWRLLRWNSERREGIVAWAVVCSITPRGISVPGEEAGSLQLSFSCSSSKPWINIPSSNLQHGRM